MRSVDILPPNLFLVGSMKCGTTSLHNYLGAHPQIFMTPEPWKEPAYFVERLNWSKGEDWYRALFRDAGDAMFRGGLRYDDPAQMASALEPLIGRFGRLALLLLILNSAVLGATAISLSSAWAWGEVMGWKNTLQARLTEAPGFYSAYAVCTAAAAGLTLIPGAPLQEIILWVQVLAGIMLPAAVVLLQLLLNDREMLGARFVNRRWNNVVNWSVIALLFGLSFVLAVRALLPAGASSSSLLY